MIGRGWGPQGYWGLRGGALKGIGDLGVISQTARMRVRTTFKVMVCILNRMHMSTHSLKCRDRLLHLGHDLPGAGRDFSLSLSLR
jgi:hypothetical protein